MKAKAKKRTLAIPLMKEIMKALGLILSDAKAKYYKGVTTPLSDTQFDYTERALENLEHAFPELRDPKSPTGRIGS